MIAQLIEIRRSGNRNDLLLSALQIERPEIAGARVSRAALGKRGACNVEPALVALLLEIAALSVHGEDVHHAIAVRQKINPLIPKHGIARSARPISRQGHRFAAAVETPQGFVVTALIAFRETGLFSPAGEEKLMAVGGVDRLRAFGQG